MVSNCRRTAAQCPKHHRNFLYASGVGERIRANDSLAPVHCSELAEVLHAFPSRHVQYSLLIQWDPIARWNQALAIIPTLFQNLVLLQASACEELSCLCARRWDQWLSWSFKMSRFYSCHIHWFIISMSFDIWYVYIYIFWYHSSMYISVLCTCLKARAHWRRCVGLACHGGPGRERIPGDPGDPYNWNPIFGIRRFDKDMQLFYKILLWREGCLLSSWKPFAAAPADLFSILKHCIKLLKICLQPKGSAARFCDQFEIARSNGFVTLV